MATWYEEVNKKLDRKVISKGGEVLEMPRIKTGSLSLDVETGGGIPVGRITTFTGEYMDGKTSVVLKILANFQKTWPNKEVVWIDAEGSWDNPWASTLGVDVDNVLVVRPDYSEQAFDIAQKAIMEDVGLLVIDSMAALSPRNEAESDMETNTVALQARLNKKFMRKAQGALLDTEDSGDVPPTIILINQLMVNIGAGPYSSTSETGGKALQYYPALKIKLRRGKLYPESNSVNDEGVEPKAQSIRFFTEKNKTAPPHRRGHFWFYFDTLDEHRQKGQYDRLEEVIRYGHKYDIIHRPNKVMHEFPDPDTGEVVSVRGSNALAEHLRENPKHWEYIEEKVMEVVYNGEGENTVPEDEEGEGVTERGEAEVVLSGEASSEES